MLKLDNSVYKKELKMQALEEIIYTIEVYLIINNINITKLQVVWILPNEDMAIKIIIIAYVEKLKNRRG